MSTFRWTKKNRLLVLKEMRELLARPDGWTKGAFSRERFLKDHHMHAYCLLGAERHVLLRLGITPFKDLDGAKLSIRTAVKRRGFDDVINFNDNHTTRKKDVLALLDECIAELEGSS